MATLLLTRSPRTTIAGELLRWGADEAAVDALLVRGTLSESLALRLRRVREPGPIPPIPSSSPTRIARTTSSDGHPIAPRDLLGRWPVVLFWPDDLQLVKAGPEARRRLLDVLLSQLDRGAADELVRYRRVLEQRNSLLRRLHLEGGDAPDHLRTFDDALVLHGAGVRVARTGLVRTLGPLAAAAMAEISDAADALEMRYVPHGATATDDREEAMAALRRTLARRSRGGAGARHHGGRSPPRRHGVCPQRRAAARRDPRVSSGAQSLPPRSPRSAWSGRSPGGCRCCSSTTC